MFVMNVVNTYVGKMYVVECSEPVTVTNVFTGGVVAQGDGSAQVFFVACAAQYEVSSDSAIVTEVFKLAPRRKLALLQGVAGGWLPKGFTELEWLETSGTQYIDTGIITNGSHALEIKITDTGSRYQFWCGRTTAWETSPETNSNSAVRVEKKENAWNLCVEVTKRYGYDLYPAPEGLGLDVIMGENGLPLVTAPVTLRWSEQQPRMININGADLRLGDFNTLTLDVSNAMQFPYYLFKVAPKEPAGGSKIIHYFKMWNGEGEMVIDLVPVLDADGSPCMFDKVSRRCFYNVGSGTFGWQLKNAPAASAYTLRGRRNPGYTAPSGVWARLAGENEPELVADTEEVSGDDWLHFANTAEAYEHFGIVQEEVL